MTDMKGEVLNQWSDGAFNFSAGVIPCDKGCCWSAMISGELNGYMTGIYADEGAQWPERAVAVNAMESARWNRIFMVQLMLVLIQGRFGAVPLSGDYVKGML